MNGEGVKLSQAKFSCLQCGADNLVYPHDLDEIRKLTGQETRDEAMDYLRCKICGGEVTISVEDQRALYMSDRSVPGRALAINRRQYSAVVRVKGKVTICCGDINIVLESENDEVLGELAGILVNSLNAESEGAAIVEIPESVTVSLA
jgi:DNA-directed RNA polymerase subunit RPC12/RpoP